MGSSVRSYLAAGIAAMAAGAITIAPATPTSTPARPVAVRVAPRIDLAASVRALVATPPNPAHVASVQAAVARIDPAAAARIAATQPALLTAAPVPLNAASDWIVSAYQFIQPWVTYGVQLADYVLGFIPFGYVIADQINIFYYNLVLPISDSIVYGLVVPVVNDPLNPASYVNGLITVGQASVNAAINTAVAEFNYFFGWLIPPLPPLPLAAARTVAPAEPVTATVADTAEPSISQQAEQHRSEATVVEVSAAPAAEVTTESPAPPKTAEAPAPSELPAPSVAPEPTTPKPSETPEPTKAPETTAPETMAPEPPTATITKPPTTTSVGGVQAQGEVRGSNAQTPATASTPAAGSESDEKGNAHHTAEPSAPKASAAPGADESGPSDGGSGTSTDAG